MNAKFLSAEWRKLIMANYEIDPSVLKPFLPAGTELDTWQGKHFVSLVGFMFLNTRVMGIRIPFHINFPEINLRFYVRHHDGNNWKRGVVFLKEIVPKPAISFVANTLFDENYISLAMKHFNRISHNKLEIGYEWRYQKKWNRIAATVDLASTPLANGSEEEFITEHFWGYAAGAKGLTTEYQVAHPRWEIYKVQTHDIVCDFEALYGSGFGSLSNQAPQSVFLAEGSEISIFKKNTLMAGAKLR